MLTIGALARAAGTTPRAVRHYHAIGLLPEPARHPGGYRDYDSRALLQLLRIRRLVELGLSLAEVRDALAGDDDRALREILAELVDDLERQEASLRRRREALRQLLDSDTDALVPEQLAGTIARLRERTDPGFAAREGELLELLSSGMPSADLATLTQVVDEGLEDDALVRRSHELSLRFERLAQAPASAPEVSQLATEMAEMARATIAAAGTAVPEDTEAEDDGPDTAAWTAYRAALSPAQQRCLALLESELAP